MTPYLRGLDCKAHLCEGARRHEDVAGHQVTGDDVIHVVRVMACEARHACSMHMISLSALRRYCNSLKCM